MAMIWKAAMLVKKNKGKQRTISIESINDYVLLTAKIAHHFWQNPKQLTYDLAIVNLAAIQPGRTVLYSILHHQLCQGFYMIMSACHRYTKPSLSAIPILLYILFICMSYLHRISISVLQNLFSLEVVQYFSDFIFYSI